MLVVAVTALHLSDTLLRHVKTRPRMPDTPLL